MKYPNFTTAIRGLFMRVLRTPKVSVIIACALILMGIGIMSGLSLATTQPVNASGTCIADTGYTLPSALQLSNAPGGLTVQDDGISTYGVGGESIDSVRSALNTCAPSFMSKSSGEFLAYTSYTIDWSYHTQRLSDGTCRLDDVKVGLHLSQLEPNLVGNSTPTVQSKWSLFIDGLQTHENGHKAIDIVQANALLSSLTTLHASCSAIESSVRSFTTTSLQDFVTANADHDIQTDYGIDQGAIW